MGLLSFLIKKRKKRKYLDDNTEMDNVIDSMFNSKPIYDELKVKCHPDLYLDKDKKESAQKLFQELQKSKHDIIAMKKLKPEIDSLYLLR